MKLSLNILKLTALSVITSSFFLASCGKKDKDGADNTDKDKETITFKGKGGVEFKTGKSVQLPNDWPDDIPISNGATIKMSQKLPPKSHNLVLHSPQAGTEIASYYKKEMSAVGWEEVRVIDVPNGAMLSYKKGQRSVNISIASSGDKPTSVTINLVN